MYANKKAWWALACGNVAFAALFGAALYNRAVWKGRAEQVGVYLVTATTDMTAERDRYNALVVRFNGEADEYNEMVNSYQQRLEQKRIEYNELVGKYNKLQADSHAMYQDAAAIMRGDVAYLKSKGYQTGE